MMTQEDFVDSVDQDQTAQNMQSDLRSTVSTFLCPRIDWSGAYCFSGVRLSWAWTQALLALTLFCLQKHYHKSMFDTWSKNKILADKFWFERIYGRQYRCE